MTQQAQALVTNDQPRVIAIPTANSIAQTAPANINDHLPKEFEPYIKFNGNSGVWSVKHPDGSEIPVNAQALFAIDLYNFQHGFVCWRDKKKLAEAFSRPYHNELAVIKSQMPLSVNGVIITENDYKEQYILDMAHLTTRTQYQYFASSGGAIRSTRGILKQFQDQWQLYKSDKLIPIVTLGNKSFQTDNGTSYAPFFAVKEWLTPAEVEVNYPAPKVVGVLPATSTTDDQPF